MSTYTSGRASLNAHIDTFMNQCLRDGEKQLASLCNRGLTACELALYSEQLNHLNETRESLSSIKQKLGENVISYAQEHHKAQRLADSLKAMAGKVTQFEFRAISATTETTLREMQFATRLVQRGGRTAIEATRGNSKLLVLVEDRGAKLGTAIKTDWAGMADTSCLKIQEIFEKKLIENGVAISNIASAKRHIDPRGGQLISEAGKIHAINLAEGLLQSEESKIKRHCKTLFEETNKRDNRQKGRE